MKKVLFILKRKDNFSASVDSHIGVSTGLYNSAQFVNNMLVDSGVTSNMEVVIDNNYIDREVTKYRPTHVIIEALWVVPTKFAVLCKLHPTVTWIIRLHSELPFLAGEGMAMDWLGDYASYPNVIIGVNAPRMMEEVRFYYRLKYRWSDSEIRRRVVYLPNYYPTDFVQKPYNRDKDHIDIGCFGAVRPLKNHMLQAFAALKLANHLGKKLHFHINGGRVEMKGEPIINNLHGLFEQLYETGHQIINHQWTPRDEFLGLCAQMDIGMQCNFSETFNIVGADFISQGVPFLGCKEIPWAYGEFNCDPTSCDGMFGGLLLIDASPDRNVREHAASLKRYVGETRRIWNEYFKEAT